MTQDEGAGPVESAPALPGPARQGGALPALVFAGFLVIGLASFGTSALVLSGIGRMTVVQDADTTGSTTATAAPARAAATRAGATTAGATPAGGPVRVTAASGRSTALASGDHEVTFTWTLEGARENDPVVVHVYAGNQFLGEQRGVLDASVFSFASGILRISASLPCSSGGWTAEIVSIRGQPIAGDSEAVISGVTCR